MRIARKLFRAGAGLVAVSVLACSPLIVGEMTAPNSGKQVLDHLNRVLKWFRQWDSADIYAMRVDDEMYIDNGQAFARQVVKLEFQSALAEAALIGQTSEKTAQVDTTQNAVDGQNIVKMQQSIGPQIQTLKMELDAINRKLPLTAAKQRAALMAQRDTLQEQIQLAQALQDNLQKITSFMTSAENANGVATELTGKILALQRTVPTASLPTVTSPVAAGGKSQAVPKTVPPALPVVSAQDEGLVGQIEQMFHLVGALRALDQIQDETQDVQTSTQRLRAPLLAALRATLQEGQLEIQSGARVSGASEPANPVNKQSTSAIASSGSSSSPSHAATTPQATAVQDPHAMEAVVQRFKLLSSAAIPLSQELILLEQSQASLNQLQASIEREYISVLRSVLLRVAAILFFLGLIWLFSELWRRATFRYIRDARRRRQFLVLRRVVTGFCMFVIILLGFVSDFSSLATYAGLITAGVAVALQTVILSVAAYFFLVGRFGVRVGDRITVVYSGAIGVSGEVVDIGLVRFYMMELSGSGIDMQPTGRIVVFSNSILFQATPLFKQIPGTEYIWRELALPLHPESDVPLAEKELLAFVNRLYADYQPVLEKQHLAIEQNFGLHMETPKPYTRVRFTNSGLEAIARYPIPLRQAQEVDDRMVFAITELLRKNPAIRLADGAIPELRSGLKT